MQNNPHPLDGIERELREMGFAIFPHEPIVIEERLGATVTRAAP